MEEFLKTIPVTISKLQTNPDIPVTIVLGNESCDLDSAVSSVAFSHFLSFHTLSLPFLNIPREDVPLRTEVIHSIGSKNVENIPTRDDLDLLLLTNLTLILVDHHILAKHYENLISRVVQIIDHRQIMAEFCDKVSD